ncbi:MAG: radical SAM protein [Pseudobutyrivibrio sp.]|nr:radical SAM protein [Pseudobutyrivibrio sp.]
MKLTISSEIKSLNREDKVIFLNRINGKWIKVPKEIANIVKYADEKKMTLKNLKDMMHDDEDADYIEKVAYKLKEINFYDFQKTKERKINNISYAITHRCNLKCIHCMVNAESGGIEYFSTKDVIDILKKIVEAGPESITITGGEPLVRKDFWEISSYLKSHYCGKLGLMTNGTLITKENAKRLVKYYENFDISLDGVDEETCSIIRGKGVFEKVIKAIDSLKDAGATKISTSMILSEDNSKYTKEYFELNKKLGTTPMLRAMSLDGRAKENREILSREQTKKIDQCMLARIQVNIFLSVAPVQLGMTKSLLKQMEIFFHAIYLRKKSIHWEI